MATRKKIYYPEGQIQKGLYTEGKEWMLEDGTEYVGDYHKYSTGEVFTKSSYIKNVSELLIPYVNLNIREFKEKFEYDRLIGEPREDFVFATYGVTPPTQKEYDFGYFKRYFVKRHFDNIIIEVTFDTFDAVQEEHYVKVEIGWKLTGDVVDVNYTQITLANEKMVGLRNYITNYSEFAKV